MSTQEVSIGASSVPTSDAGASQSAEYTPSSTPTTDTTPAPSEQTAGSATTGVQGDNQATSQPDDDVLAGVPSLEDLNQLPEDSQYKKSLVQMRKAIEETFKPKLAQYSAYDSILEQFDQPDQLKESLSLRDNLIAWDTDPDTGAPIPAPNVQVLQEQYPQHADFVVADLLNLPTVDPDTGRTLPRSDLILEAWRDIPERRAHAARILGLVEPSAVAPQWQPSEDELAVVRPELQDTYRSMPYEDREELKLNSPEFINRTLEREKFQAELVERDKAVQAERQQEVQQREQYFNEQAKAAGNEYVGTQLNQALTTFHESVVQQCNFIKPLDPQALPQGMTPEQATQMNQQIAMANKADAVQITGLITSLFNGGRDYVLPMLREIGAVDDKMLAAMDQAANTFSNNGRNYGNLNYRNSQGKVNYQPSQDVTQMSNEAQRALQKMVGYAKQISGKLMNYRSQFFEMKAQDHNATLNGAAAVRPPLNGQGYNPTTAPAGQLPTGRMSKAEIDRLYG